MSEEKPDLLAATQVQVLWSRSWIADYAATNARLMRDAGYRGDPVTRCAMKVPEEAGELVGAFMRCTGQARRSGTEDEFHAEVADTVLACYVLAAEAGFDLDAAVAAKLEQIYARGWKQGAAS